MVTIWSSRALGAWVCCRHTEWTAGVGTTRLFILHSCFQSLLDCWRYEQFICCGQAHISWVVTLPAVYLYFNRLCLIYLCARFGLEKIEVLYPEARRYCTHRKLPKGEGCPNIDLETVVLITFGLVAVRLFTINGVIKPCFSFTIFVFLPTVRTTDVKLISQSFQK